MAGGCGSWWEAVDHGRRPRLMAGGCGLWLEAMARGRRLWIMAALAGWAAGAQVGTGPTGAVALAVACVAAEWRGMWPELEGGPLQRLLRAFQN